VVLYVHVAFPCKEVGLNKTEYAILYSVHCPISSSSISINPQQICTTLDLIYYDVKCLNGLRNWTADNHIQRYRRDNDYTSWPLQCVVSSCSYRPAFTACLQVSVYHGERKGSLQEEGNARVPNKIMACEFFRNSEELTHL
jgi:hypothetical protein